MIDFGKVKAVIFDNDGVIVNSEPLSCKALRNLLKQEYNIEIDDACLPVIGMSDISALSYYLKKHDKPLPSDFRELVKMKSEFYFDLAENELDCFPGFHELMRYLQQHYDLAVASSGNHDKIKFSLDAVNASQYFPIICSATEVAHGKPAPDLFHYTADCLNVAEKNCLVIEDSPKGTEGAKAAGMQVVGFTSSFPDSILKNAGADQIISSFPEFLKMIKYNREELNRD